MIIKRSQLLEEAVKKQLDLNEYISQKTREEIFEIEDDIKSI